MKNDYTEFDAAMIRHILGGFNTAFKLTAQLSPLILKFPETRRMFDPTPQYRIVDRRLQALRKAGRLSFNGKTWSVQA